MKFIFFNIWLIIKKKDEKILLGNVFHSFTETVGIIYNKIINQIHAKLKMYFSLYLHK